MNRKLSVVVPVYNIEKYLCQCIESILKQTYSDIEIILVDDGSADTSGKICDTYAKSDRRIKVIHQKNEGLIKARHNGAEMAEGSYITFVDGDDWIASNTYEKMMREMEYTDVVIAGVYRYFSENEVKTDTPMLKEGTYDRGAIGNSIIPYMLWSKKRNTWELDPSLCTKIFKKELLVPFLKRATKLDIYFGEDTAVIFPFMLMADSVVIMHECFYYHRQRLRGVSPSYIKETNYFVKLYALYDYLKKEFSQSVYWELLSPQLEHFYVNAVQLKQQSFCDYQETDEDVFPFWNIKKDADIVLYGAGETGKRFYVQNEQYHFCNIALWVDQNYEKVNFRKEQIVSPECIAGETFDFIIIAVRSARIVQEIMEMLIKMGVPTEKIIWSSVLVRSILLEADKKEEFRA